MEESRTNIKTNSSLKRKFIIAGGGTGGHIFPAIAIANALREKKGNCEILFVGAKGKMEMEKVPQAGYKIVGLDIAGFNRSSLIKNLSLPLKLLKSFWQVRQIINGFKPDAVIGVGGYSSFPVLRYAQSKGIPSFIHEANSFGGKSNILLSKKATAVYVASEGMEKFFPKEKIKITGNPVRNAIVNRTATREEALSFFGLNDDKPVLLIVGGSLGAQSINEAVAKHLGELLAAGLQVIWQTGKPFLTKAKEKTGSRQGVWANDFITRMELAYAAADIVVSRSGAMTVAELCVVKKPVVFVPYPFAAEDHQTVNAQQLVNKQAAMRIPDNELERKLAPVIITLASNKEWQEVMKKNIALLGITDADAVIADEIFKKIG